MDVRLKSFLGFAANHSANAFKILGNSMQAEGRGADQYGTDTILRLDSPGSSIPTHVPSSKGTKRKWDLIDGCMGQRVDSSLSLGLGRSTSSSDSKGSSAAACTAVSSAKDVDEESSMDIELDFSLHLGCEKVQSQKKLVNSSLKTLELQPGTSDRSESLMSEGGRSTPEVNGSNDCCAPLAPETIEIPDTHFFNFDAGRSLEKFQIGQIWAFYSDEDGLPKYYGRINKIVTSPDLELHVSWLTCYWLPENTTEWEDKDMGVLISCGRYNVNKTDEFLSIFSTTSSVSHQVHAESVGKNTKYAIFPRKGEVWALYRKWTNKMKCSELKNWEYDIVEVIEETDLFIIVLVLEFVSGFSSVFRGKSNEISSVKLRIPRKELLRFSHRIPAFKLTEEHGKLRDFWELDPGALPTHYFGLR